MSTEVFQTIATGASNRTTLITMPQHATTSANDENLSALPSRAARAVAFIAILVSGALGGALGFAITRASCADECVTASGVGLLVGAVCAAAGCAVLVVLALRAMGEWHEARDRERAGHGL